MPSTTDNPGFGVYVHWPFCAQKCPYCDFNSHVRFGGVDEVRFLAAFLRELDHTAGLVGSRNVESIFFGGGTPSLMEARTVGAILDRIGHVWTVDRNAEITLEANPGSVEAQRFRGYREAGINRISLGVQSLRDDVLRSLGRIHTAAEAKTAIEIARAAFDRFSFDLIYARPRQNAAAWAPELREALGLAGGHLSLYQLTIEPDTPFAALHAAGKLNVPDGDVAHALYDVTQELTAAAGLPAYEISNHAAPGEESRHNLIYWRTGEYAGIGPGAHGRLRLSGARHATSTERNPERWLELVERDGHGRVEAIPLTAAETTDEMLLMGLRLTEGVELDRLARQGGMRPTAAAIAELTELGLLEAVPGPVGSWRLCATRKGRFVLNEIVLRLSMSFARREDRQSPMDFRSTAD